MIRRFELSYGEVKIVGMYVVFFFFDAYSSLSRLRNIT